MKASDIILAGLLLGGGYDFEGTLKKSVEDITGYAPPKRTGKTEAPKEETPFKGRKTSKSRKARKKAKKVAK